jgi:hypothetical protein
MRFVSKHANYMFVARPDKIQMVLGSGGMMMPQTVEAAIMCQFQHGMVRPDECELAKQHWLGFGRREDGTQVAYGATPTTVVGVVNGQAHEGWNPDLMFSVFDTDSIPNEEDRRIAEDRLLNDPGFGLDHIRVDEKQLEAPWPTYDQDKGKKGLPTAEIICTMVREGGYDIDYVIAYENQKDRPRVSVIEALEKLKVELAEEASEAEALKREITA